ncbi:hypothetical protein GIW05_00730 [Pseudomonas syringae]|uniref:hypothetical protein n=1 Tax=Pseudomonas syringae TaxID=317 RepID=UPI001F3F59FE|nr:hypothetical protein [Pseudomonas syringae]MCF5382046.1 hypothetical protein [Pseudomonas syringae]MCF5419420.1 hypothetical protein [Pseudomonas syringae]MCF5451967.1 hypothetical protein [Pseudomonas syringae]MCF5458751.1 hypothetical protein [Pseudomonas syringae]
MDEVMNQQEFARKLSKLAGGYVVDGAGTDIDATGILGRLGFARTVRRVQALGLIAGICGIGVISMNALSLSGGLPVGVVALGIALATLVLLRLLPYWTPQTALREGLLALAGYNFYDFDRFAAGIKSPLTAVNNTLLGELCMQLAKDQRHQQNR